jgi:RNA polymerase-binding transcription factor
MITDLKQVRRNLEARLNEAISNGELTDSIRIQQLADPSDMTHDAAERDVAVQILDRESALIRQLRTAINRVNNGSYGVCLECEEEIAEKRLKAVPWAERCIACQETVERLTAHGKRAVAFEEGAEAA